MMDLARKLWRIPRSITGNGVRVTLSALSGECDLPLEVHEVPSGTKVFDWAVPDEWNVNEALIDLPNGHTVATWGSNRLHLVGYSRPVGGVAYTRKELDAHLHSIPDQPDAVPYVTSYYKRDFGFCVTQNLRDRLPDGNGYHFEIDADLSPGSLTYADLVIPGRTKDEILFSTYTCHPQQANDGLSGILVQAELAKWLLDRDNRYTYRFVFCPETIGSITYLAKHLDHLKRRVKAGFVLTCLGAGEHFSYIPSRYGDTLADRAARAALEGRVSVTYSYRDRGSDERQYTSPGVDLPVCSVTRAKHGEYPEYHTSLDNLDFISEAVLKESLRYYKHVVRLLEHNRVLRVAMPCEPKLDRHGLYPTTSKKGVQASGKEYLDVLAYSDGTNDTLEVAQFSGLPARRVAEMQETLEGKGLLV